MHNFFPFTYREHLSRPPWTKKIHVKGKQRTRNLKTSVHQHRISHHNISTWSRAKFRRIKGRIANYKKKKTCLTTNSPNSYQNKCIVPVRRSKKKARVQKAQRLQEDCNVDFFSFQRTLRNLTSLSFLRNLITRCPLILIWQQLHPVSWFEPSWAAQKFVLVIN